MELTGVLNAPASKLERLGTWYEVRYPALLRFAYVICRDAGVAEDLVQESFVRIHRAWRRAELEGLDAYARRTIVNLHRSSFRRLTRERRAAAELARSDHHPAPDHDSVWEAMSRLSTRQRVCVALRYYEGLSESETAGVLGLSAGSVKRHVHRAMEKLRAIVGEEP